MNCPAVLRLMLMNPLPFKLYDTFQLSWSTCLFLKKETLRPFDRIRHVLDKRRKLLKSIFYLAFIIRYGADKALVGT